MRSLACRAVLAPVFLAATLAGCADFEVPQDPCSEANRSVTLDHLFENTALGNYDRCLSETREEAVKALGG